MTRAVASFPEPRVDAWRIDVLCYEGWLQPFALIPASPSGRGIPSRRRPQGWYSRRRATCMDNSHRAPSLDCTCGVHGVKRWSLPLADDLDILDAQRTMAAEHIEGASECNALTLSRAVIYDALPSAYPDRESLHRSDDLPDPPTTIRGHFLEYRHIFADRRWAAEDVPNDPRLAGWWPKTTYVPDLGAYVRDSVNAEADAEIDRLLDQMLEA